MKKAELLLEPFREAWPKALKLWNRFVQLSEPRWCFYAKDEKTEGLSGSFAMIRLTDHAVVISLRQIAELNLAAFALEILAHELGHHVYCPAELDDNGKLMARIRAALSTAEQQSPMIANLYADLLINDRLQHRAGLNLAGIYQELERRNSSVESKLWQLYLRIYEVLWKLQPGTLVKKREKRIDFDARVGARLIRYYQKHWLDGAGRFAMLCLPYLLEDQEQLKQMFKPLFDTEHAGGDEIPGGLAEIDPEEIAGAVDPATDDNLNGLGSADEEIEEEAAGKDAVGKKKVAKTKKDQTGPPLPPVSSTGGGQGQYREPFQYGELLRNLGISITDQEAAIRYYRERAIPQLVPFPVKTAPESTEPQPEGLDLWELGSDPERIDWFESLSRSPYVVPGVTTVERYYGTSPGADPDKLPLDLDLYIDSSGSMPCPTRNTSYLTLAGAIIALSALRAGARVQATLWSGTRQFIKTDGFVSDEHDILRVLTGYFGGGTAFPIHILRETFLEKRQVLRPTHIMVISDDGVTTMFEKDEKRNSGWDIARAALEKAGGGGSLVLNLFGGWQHNKDLRRAEAEGWKIHCVTRWEELVVFAREFSRAAYGNTPGENK